MTAPPLAEGRPPGGGIEAFAAGRTIVHRDLFEGRLWSARPLRVEHDDGADLVCCMWPGVKVRAPTTWISWLQTGDARLRNQAVANLAAHRWETALWTWQHRAVRSHFLAGELFSVHRYYSADGTSSGWYVNFELPFTRHLGGIDTFDLLIDLLVDDDLITLHWKDEDEYAEGRRLGLFDEALDGRVQVARARALELVQSRAGPFSAPEVWRDWRPDPTWPLPEMPEAYTCETSAGTMKPAR